jgi:hypothetical protein
MGQARSEFWQATPFEFWALYEGFFGKAESNAPMTQSELSKMMEKYPDGKGRA